MSSTTLETGKAARSQQDDRQQRVVLVSGSSGLVGRALLERLAHRGLSLRSALGRDR